MSVRPASTALTPGGLWRCGGATGAFEFLFAGRSSHLRSGISRAALRFPTACRRALLQFTVSPDCILLPVSASIGAYQRLMRVLANGVGVIAGHNRWTISLRAGEGGFNRNEPGVSTLPCATPFNLRNNSFGNFRNWFGAPTLRRRLAGLHVVCWAFPSSLIRDECRPVVTRILVGPDLGLKVTNALCCTTGQIILNEYDVVLFHDQNLVMEAYQRAVRTVPKVGTEEGHLRNV